MVGETRNQKTTIAPAARCSSSPTSPCCGGLTFLEVEMDIFDIEINKLKLEMDQMGDRLTRMMMAREAIMQRRAYEADLRADRQADLDEVAVRS